MGLNLPFQSHIHIAAAAAGS